MSEPTPPPNMTPELAAAITELRQNQEAYTDLIKALRDKSAGKALSQLGDVYNEGIKDYAAAAPVLNRVVEDFKEGRNTSEFKMASRLNQLLISIALLSPAIEGVIAYFDHSDFAGISMYVAGASVVLKLINTYVYNSYRTRLKVAAIEAEAKIISHESDTSVSK